MIMCQKIMKTMRNREYQGKKRNLDCVIFSLIISITIIISLNAGTKNVYAEESQVYESSIKLITSSDEGLYIDLITPDNSIYNPSSELEFRFTVSYNRSLTLHCNLSVDDDVVESITITDGNEKEVGRSLLLYEGHHTWNVQCKDSDQNYAESETHTFLIDLQSPTVRLNNPNPELVLVNYINLSFTPADNYASEVDCTLTIMREDTGLVYSILGLPNLNNGRDEIIHATDLDHGNYSWDVSCTDEAGNTGNSPHYDFMVDLKKDFSIVSSKSKYNMGEGGVYVINAPFESDVKVLITNPDYVTIERDYKGPYPVVDSLNMHNLSGTYTLYGYLTYNNAVKEITTSYQVANSLDATIDINSGGKNKDRETFREDEKINFTAYTSGGIGDIHYEWEWGDDTARSQSKSVKRSYEDEGSYKVTLRVWDDYGNEVTDEVTILIREEFRLTVTVLDNYTRAPVQKAKVYLQGELEKTDKDGRAEYDVFEGTYSLTVLTDYHEVFFDKKFKISDNTNKTIELVLEDLNLTENDTIIELIEINDSTQFDIKSEEDGSDDKESEDEDFVLVDKKSEAMIDNLTSRINKALGDMEQMDLQTKAIAFTLNMLDMLERAQKGMTRARRDLFNIEQNRRNLSEGEVEREKESLFARVDEMASKAVTSIELIKSIDYIKYPEQDEVDEISEEYLQFYDINLNDKTRDNFITANRRAQQELTVSTAASSIILEFLSGDREKAILVEHNIKYTENAPGSEVIVTVPKEIASNIENITLISENRVINPDPIISFNVTDEGKIVYYIIGDIELEEMKKISTVLVADPDNIEFKKGGITSILGMAIFSKVTQIDDPIIVLQIAVIVILLLIYLVYQFELIDKVKSAILFRDRELEEIQSQIKDTKACLASNEVTNAEVVYQDVMKAYKALPKDKKTKVHKVTIQLYNDILIAKIDEMIELGLSFLKEKETAKATEQYQKIQGIYKVLPKDQKSKISDRCKILFEKLSAST